MEPSLAAMQCHLPYGIIQYFTCHLTQVNTPHLNPSQTSRYSIYLPHRDGRLSWPRWLVVLLTVELVLVTVVVVWTAAAAVLLVLVVIVVIWMLLMWRWFVNYCRCQENEASFLISFCVNLNHRKCADCCHVQGSYVVLWIAVGGP